MATEITESDVLEYASLSERFFGSIIDNVFLALSLGPIAVFPESLAGVHFILWIAFALFYIFILEGVSKNQTVGKYVMKMKVAKDDGSRAGISNSLVRNTVGVIGQFFGWIGLVIGAIAIHQSEENKRLGDNVAGTVVIKIRNSNSQD